MQEALAVLQALKLCAYILNSALGMFFFDFLKFFVTYGYD